MSGMGLAGSSSVIRAAFLLELPGGTHLLPFKRVIYFPAAPVCHLHLHPSAPGSFFHLQRRQRVIMALLPPSYWVQWLHWTDRKSPQYPPRLKVFTFITSAYLLPPEVTCSQALRDEDVDISGDRGSVHHTTLFFLEVGFTWVCFCSVLPWAPWVMMLHVWQMLSLPNQLCMHFCTTWMQPTLS